MHTALTVIIPLMAISNGLVLIHSIRRMRR